MAPVLGFAEPVSSWTHLAAALFALALAPALVGRGRTRAERWGLAVFALAGPFLFAMSGVYHLLGRDGSGGAVLRRLDHAAIWVFIAATFTPVHIIGLRGPWRWLGLALVWALAVTGLILKTVFFDGFPEWLGLVLYVGLGWLGGLAWWQLRLRWPLSAVDLVAGGALYTLAGLVAFLEWPALIPGVLGPHELSHLVIVWAYLRHVRMIMRLVEVAAPVLQSDSKP